MFEDLGCEQTVQVVHVKAIWPRNCRGLSYIYIFHVRQSFLNIEIEKEEGKVKHLNII